MGRHIKTTEKKKIFIHWLAKSEHPLSADELYLKLRNSNIKISMSTVYRYLHQLVEEHKIQKVKAEYGVVLFYLDPLELLLSS